MNKKTIAILAVLGVLLFGLAVGGGVVLAKTTSSYPLIVQKIADRFNLQPEEVNEVFEEVRQERHEQREAFFEERLEAAVEAGEITEEQKEAILEKKAEIQKEVEAIRESDLTPQEKREKMAKLRKEVRSWAEENDLDSCFYLMRGFGPRFGKGKGGQAFGGGQGCCPDGLFGPLKQF